MEAKKFRIIFYATIIILVLIQIQFHLFDKLAIKWVQILAQNKNLEYRNYYLGEPLMQYPNDLMTYSDLIYKTKPAVIIETGTFHGGLAMYLATILEKVNASGKVISVDIDDNNWNNTVKSGKMPEDLHKRIIFVKGDSASQEVIEKIKKYCHDKKGIVILDSLHTKEHVLKELRLYSQFVSTGSYLIVNDTHLDHLMLNKGWEGVSFGQGPRAAANEFLKNSNQFVRDDQLPRFYISCAQSGFLKRVQ